jgi:hypothetical protein
MSIVWERRIRHISRPVKPTRLGNLRGRVRKAEVKARRGRPSRSLPSDLVFGRITLRTQLRLGLPQAADALARLDLDIMRYRITERQRARREAAQQRRRPRVEDTVINLWRRRRDWLLEVEAANGSGGLVEGVNPLNNKALPATVGDDA